MKRCGLTLVLAAAAAAVGGQACAQSVDDPPPQRPSIMFNRWQEDWSVLADPRTPREPLDGLKYIPLSPTDPKTYLSLGANLRERFEGLDAPDFGVGHTRPEDYVISRLEVHADLRIDQQVQVFTQLQSDFAPGKTVLTPVDQDRLGLEQAFVAITEPFGGGTFKLRVGRQQIGFDLQRFVSVRDGPNIRQSYDAAWADYEHGDWKIMGFYSQPVQNRDLAVFDDYSSNRLTYGGVRIEGKLFGLGSFSTSYSVYGQLGAHYLTVRGNERRDVFDVHASGRKAGFDWDVQFMNQTGHIDGEPIRAWAFGSLAGYTLGWAPWSPRLGLQADAASGDGNPHDHVLETFNPLFPNGYYVTLSGLTGYVNFIHLKPSLTLNPTRKLKLMLAAAGQWRETTADAVYTQPNIPVAGTAGAPGRYTGTYGQARADWQAGEHVAFAVEAVHFAVSDVIRRAGGHDGDYLGVEMRLGW